MGDEPTAAQSYALGCCCALPVGLLAALVGGVAAGKTADLWAGVGVGALTAWLAATAHQVFDVRVR